MQYASERTHLAWELESKVRGVVECRRALLLKRGVAEEIANDRVGTIHIIVVCLATAVDFEVIDPPAHKVVHVPLRLRAVWEAVAIATEPIAAMRIVSILWVGKGACFVADCSVQAEFEALAVHVVCEGFDPRWEALWERRWACTW